MLVRDLEQQADALAGKSGVTGVNSVRLALYVFDSSPAAELLGEAVKKDPRKLPHGRSPRRRR